MKKLTFAALALVACTGFTAKAENITINYDQDLAYPINAWVECKEDGTAYPNFRVYFPEGNGTEEAPLFTTGEMVVSCTGTDGYSYTQSTAMTYGGGIADSHGYQAQGDLPKGDYNYTFTLTLHYADETKEAYVESVSGTLAAPGNTNPFNVQLSIAANGDFVRTSSTSGTLPFIITCTGDVDQVDHYVVRASRVGEEYMDQHDVTALEGVFTLTDLPADAETGVWLKVKAVNKDGVESPEVQTGPVTCSTISATSLTYTLTASNPVGLTSTTGSVDLTLKAENTENVASWHFFVVRAGESGDVTVGETTVAASEIEDGEYTYTQLLTDLPENAETPIWAKVEAIMENGTTGAIAQYPGQEQGWTGLSITTSNTQSVVETIALDANSVVDVYTVAGVRVRTGVKAADAFRGLPAGLYIAGGKKVVVK